MSATAASQTPPATPRPAPASNSRLARKFYKFRATLRKQLLGRRSHLRFYYFLPLQAYSPVRRQAILRRIGLLLQAGFHILELPMPPASQTPQCPCCGFRLPATPAPRATLSKAEADAAATHTFCPAVCPPAQRSGEYLPDSSPQASNSTPSRKSKSTQEKE